jgi:hypothetical protein
MSGNSQPTLQLGSSGPAVSTLQSDLNAAGYSPPLTVDGEFGASTQAAVEWFQRENGLSVDGVAGPSTWAALGAGGSSQDLPISNAAAAAFAKALGLQEVSADDDLVGDLAAVLQVPSEGVAETITPGDTSTILAVLRALSAGAPSSAAARLSALVSLYAADAALDAKVLLVLSMAASQIGTVIASVSDGASPPSCVGADRLAEFFAESFGNQSWNGYAMRFPPTSRPGAGSSPCGRTRWPVSRSAPGTSAAASTRSAGSRG